MTYDKLRGDGSHRTRFIFSCAPHLAATVIPLTYQVMQKTVPFPLEHKALPDTPEARAELLLNNKADVIFDYAIACRKDHPRFSDSISLKAYHQEKQAAVGCLSLLTSI